MTKLYLSADELLADSYRLADTVLNSDFQPDLVVGIWRGGAAVAAALHEYLRYHHQTPDHIAIRASSYSGINAQTDKVELEGMDYLAKALSVSANILLVDDIFDTGNTMAAIVKAITSIQPNVDRKCLKIATPWYKPSRNQTELKPDFYLHETDSWVVFPHELCGLSAHEIQRNKPFIGTAASLFAP